MADNDTTAADLIYEARNLLDQAWTAGDEELRRDLCRQAIPKISEVAELAPETKALLAKLLKR